MGVGWEETAQTVTGAVPTAKLHVLGLSPLKAKLGPKWERLSDLVHKLFERAIAKAQRPGDHFVVLDELSYAVTFSNLSLDQADLVCATIAREVCEHLFGNHIDEISVRSLVAEIVTPSGIDAAHVGAQLEALLERHGVERVITQSAQSGAKGPVVAVASHPQKPAAPPIEQLRRAEAQLLPFGLKQGLFPIWDLRKGVSSSILVAPFSATASAGINFGLPVIAHLDEEQISDIEIGQLQAAAAFAERVHRENKICAVSVGVGYESLCRFRSRIAYLTALQKVAFAPSTPLLLKIEQIPAGAPDGRIGELVAMMSLPNLRVALEFQSLASLASIGLRLSAGAIGGTLPAYTDESLAMTLLERLGRIAASQKALPFLERLDSLERVEWARRGNVRLATGLAMGGLLPAEMSELPDFPLSAGC